jgi:RHS repeat-associated protein
MAYDYENRLIQVSGRKIQEASYTYDPFGKRLSKSVGSVTKYYLYDNEDIIAEYDSNGSLLASYVHGQGIDEPILGLSPQGTVPEWYYTFDGLGSVSELTNASQAVVESYKYDAFGNLTILDSSFVPRPSSLVGNPYTYTAREYDPESGLYFYRARYYDAGTGRFFQKDPILQLHSDILLLIYAIRLTRGIGSLTFTKIPEDLMRMPQQLQGYVYVVNNPVNLIDLYGYGLKEIGGFTFCVVNFVRDNWALFSGTCGTCLVTRGCGWQFCVGCAGLIGTTIGNCL